MSKPTPQKVRLETRSLQSAAPADVQTVVNGLADDVRRLGEAHDKHDDSLQALPALPDRQVRSGVFSSAASGVTSFSMLNPLSAKPDHVTLTLRRDDAADFSAAWSWWWLYSGTQVTLKFVGLPASARILYTIEFF